MGSLKQRGQHTVAATLAKEAVAGLEAAPSAEVCCWSLSLDTLLADDPLDFSSTCIGEADRYQTTAHQEHRLGVVQETQASCDRSTNTQVRRDAGHRVSSQINRNTWPGEVQNRVSLQINQNTWPGETQDTGVITDQPKHRDQERCRTQGVITDQPKHMARRDAGHRVSSQINRNTWPGEMQDTGCHYRSTKTHGQERCRTQGVIIDNQNTEIRRDAGYRPGVPVQPKQVRRDARDRSSSLMQETGGHHRSTKTQRSGEMQDTGKLSQINKHTKIRRDTGTRGAVTDPPKHRDQETRELPQINQNAEIRRDTGVFTDQPKHWRNWERSLRGKKKTKCHFKELRTCPLQWEQHHKICSRKDKQTPLLMGIKKRLNWKTACNISDSYALVLIFCPSCHQTHSPSVRLSRVWSRLRLSFYPVKTMHKADERWRMGQVVAIFLPPPLPMPQPLPYLFILGFFGGGDGNEGGPGSFWGRVVHILKSNQQISTKTQTAPLPENQTSEDRQAHKGGEKDKSWRVCEMWTQNDISALSLRPLMTTSLSFFSLPIFPLLQSLYFHHSPSHTAVAETTPWFWATVRTKQ